MPLSSALSPAASPAILRKPPAGAMLMLFLIFIFGVTVGALAMSFTVHKMHRAINPADGLNKMTVKKWKKELSLNDRQELEIEGTLDDLTKYYKNVLADGKDRILAILDEGQKRKFEHLLQEKRKP